MQGHTPKQFPLGNQQAQHRKSVSPVVWVYKHTTKCPAKKERHGICEMSD